MIVRPWAKFGSNLPADEVEEDGEFVQLGGKPVSEAILGILRDLGCEVEGPTAAGDHGWMAHVEAQGCRMWFQVTLIKEYLFLFEQNSWWRAFSRTFSPVYLDLLSALARALRDDPRFTDVRWYPTSQLHIGDPGSSTPVARRR